MNDEPIDLLSYLRSLRRFLIPGLLVALAVAGLGYFLSNRSAEPVYHARAHVLVQPGGGQAPTADTSGLIPYIMRTYVAVEDAPELLQPTSQALGGQPDADALKELTSLYWGGGSLILAVRADGATEDEAKKRADAFADAFVAQAPKLVAFSGAQPTLRVVQRADIVPGAAGDKKSSPLTAIAAGVAAGLVTILLLEVLSRARRKRP